MEELRSRAAEHVKIASESAEAKRKQRRDVQCSLTDEDVSDLWLPMLVDGKTFIDQMGMTWSNQEVLIN